MTRTLIAIVVVAILNGRLAEAQDPPVPTPSEDDAVAEKVAKHPSIQIGHVLTLDFSGRLESDVRAATPAIGQEVAQADWQSRRIGIEGRVFKRIDFDVSRELGKDYETSTGLSEKTAWRDVYVDARLTKALRLEAGLFKLPFGHEETIGETNLDFAYRSLAARVLSPGRDAGVMAHGRLFDRMLEYQVGYFTRDGSNARTSQTSGGRDARVARFVLAPFAPRGPSPMAPLRIGVAIADSRIDDRLGIRGRTVLGDGVFFDRVSVNGRRERIGWEAAWALGPAGLSGEYIRSSDERRGMGFSGADLPTVDSSAWSIGGTWAVTGEHKHGRLEPHRDFLRGGPGAIEVAGRVETLAFNGSTYPTVEFGFPNPAKLSANADHVATIGVNWYLNHYAKVQADIIRESIDDPERSPAPATSGRFTSTVIALQFRL
jgi:phosphate-selective porin